MNTLSHALYSCNIISLILQGIITLNICFRLYINQSVKKVAWLKLVASLNKTYIRHFKYRCLYKMCNLLLNSKYSLCVTFSVTKYCKVQFANKRVVM